MPANKAMKNAPNFTSTAVKNEISPHISVRPEPAISAAIIPLPEAFRSSIVSRTTGPKDEHIPDHAKLTMFITNSPEFNAKRKVATPTEANNN